MAKDLWPEFDIDAAKPAPKTIIAQAGGGLEKKTKGLVKFYIGGARISEGVVSFECALLSPALSYMYPFLKVRFPMTDGYPVELVADQMPETLKASNEAELLAALEKIFKAQSTIDTVQRLIGLSA